MDKLTRLILERFRRHGDGLRYDRAGGLYKDLHNTYPTDSCVGARSDGRCYDGVPSEGEKTRLTININGNGPAGTVVITAGGDGTVKRLHWGGRMWIFRQRRTDSWT